MKAILITKHIDSIKQKYPFLWPAIRATVIFGLHQFSRFKIRRILKEKKVIFLDLGAGPKKGTGNWVTIDISTKCDVFWDLTCGIPFPDKSISKIYSSHFLEHLSFENGQRILDECKRVLVEDGIFSICVPNARIFLEAYVHSRPLDQEHFHFFKPAFNNTTRMDYANYIAYMEGRHKFMFDEENLIFILNAKGFRNVRLREFDSSIDLEKHDAESIYAECQK